MYPRRAAAARFEGTWTVRPSGVVTVANCGASVFQCARLERVRERDVLFFGVAISLACPSTADSSC
ncbi:hypothetical protein MCC02031_11100 [Bifidobacteriaceae bacterium MCC02031]|uniref:Uncharacterized protein n=1 Tax=Bifidobacterium dentium JCVIHMP022 TaxID=553191 RepID=A0AB72Z015_9BIFI|nr:hypothetical protein HMPREF9003_1478 [Bifidobacterium dentium JCVIHMP022]ETO96570.1 hypothetical protein HMPREF1494_1351 [Bifidobacterium sp. MSTE12]GDZ34411.1 hypothetical protein MCC02031_11100 [Bifidobacteriaceae bacterium MCC02031]GDZ40509.1 hypothetical protein MCC01970_12320 [Bifidobacteriaceae bacterium MCC01970]